MKKKIFLNLVMGISLIATAALLLASCSAQASDVKLPITKKGTPDPVSALAHRLDPHPYIIYSHIFAITFCDPRS